MSLYETILSKFFLWRKTEHMILQRAHTYLNNERIGIDNITHIAGCRVITFHKESELPSDKRYMYYAPHKHHLFTRNPEGKLSLTTVYTGRMLRQGRPQ